MPLDIKTPTPADINIAQASVKHWGLEPLGLCGIEDYQLEAHCRPFFPSSTKACCSHDQACSGLNPGPSQRSQASLQAYSAVKLWLQSVEPRPIAEIAEKLGLSPDEYEPYGHQKAKVCAQLSSNMLFQNTLTVPAQPDSRHAPDGLPARACLVRRSACSPAAE
jgi:hypothetical protein